LFAGGGALLYHYREKIASLFKGPAQGQLQFAADGSSDAGGGTPQAPAKPKSGIANEFDALISAVASRENSDPVLIKAIVQTETEFDEEAVNPEKTFTIGGQTFSASSSTGRRLLHDFIANGGDPASLGVNPSLGLAQVRVSTGRFFIPGLEAKELFDPQTNLTACARFLNQLSDQGIRLDTIDAYNVGEPRVKSGELRNLPYRDKVNKNYRLFQTDF
jgi:hypothetical protein